MSKKIQFSTKQILEKYIFEKPLIYTATYLKKPNKITFENSLQPIDEHSDEVNSEDNITSIGRISSVNGAEEH